MNKQFLTKEEDLLALSPNFKKNYCYLQPFAFVIDGRMVIVGEYEIENNEIEIKHVVSLKPRKGNGRIFIDYLLHDLHFDEVWGEAVVDAYNFWCKVGAVFEESAQRYFLEHQDDESFEFEEDFLIPFNIYNEKAQSKGA
jgi:hypothetical protein